MAYVGFWLPRSKLLHQINVTLFLGKLRGSLKFRIIQPDLVAIWQNDFFHIPSLATATSFVVVSVLDKANIRAAANYQYYSNHCSVVIQC
jgi:hypothetical protein